MDEDFEAKDLFGLPLRAEPSRRGRRRLRFTDEVYERVELLRAGGLTQEEIATALRISVPTLVKYFGPELDEALARQRAQQTELLAKAARAGNVSAIKAWGERLDRQAAAGALKNRERPRGATVVPIGRKQERQAAATRVAAEGGKFAPPPPPQLIVDNA